MTTQAEADFIARLEAAERAWRAAFADRVAALTDVAREAPRIARLRLWTPGRHLPRGLVLIDTPGLNAAAPAAAARAWAAVRALADAVLVVSDVRQAVPASLLGAVARMGVPHAALALTRADLVWRDSDAPELELAEAARAAAGRFAAALGQAELRRDPGAGGLALRAAVGGAPITETPVWRLQPIGGGGLLRHGPTGRWRSRAHGALVVEGRAPVGAAGALSLCPFAEGAWIQADGEAPGLHGGLGLGLRLALPPRPTNLLRLDAAWGDAGLGISAGWGQSF